MNQPLSQEASTITTPVLEFEPRLALTKIASCARTYAAEVTSGLLLAFMGLQMFAVIWQKSITVDELVLIPSAYYHLVDGDFQLVNEHPPLPKIIAAIPLLFVQPNEVTPTGNSPNRSEAIWAREVGFWGQNPEKSESLSFWPRVPMILLSMGLGILIFWFGRLLFNSRVAVLAVTLFTLEPTLIGHGRVVHTDVPAAFGYLLFFMTLYGYFRRRTWRWAAYLGAATAIAILTKYSMLLLGLVLAPVFIIEFWRHKERGKLLIHAATTFITIVLVVNAAYFFKHAAVNEADTQWLTTYMPAHAQNLMTLSRLLSYVLPKEFVLGILYQFWHNGEGHAAGLLGMYSQTGWWYYFPVAFLLKTTLPFLFLSLAAIGWSIFRLVRHRESNFLWLLLPAAIYSVFVLFSHIDIGVRYLIPLFPFLIILGAALLSQLLQLKARKVGLSLVVVLVAWMGIEALRAFPDHITYMNQFARRAPHWWYLSDSNVEWGDDIHDLARFLQAQGEHSVLDGTLGGFGILPLYHIENVDALTAQPGAPDQPRYLAVGASFLNGSTIPAGPPGSGRETQAGRVNYFAAYRQRKPDAIIGGSIYVFRVR